MKAGKLFSGLGWAGVLFSVCLGIGVSALVYLQPVDYFTHFPADSAWAIFYLGALVFIFATFWIKRGRFLLGVLLAVVLIVLLVPAIAAGLWFVFVIFFWLLAASLGLGRLTLRWLTPNLRQSFGEMLLLSIVLGLGEWMLLGLGLGLAGGYTPTAAYASLVLASVLGLPGLLRELHLAWPEQKRRWMTTWQTQDLRLPALALGVLLVCGFGAYLWSIAPAIRWDSLSYHLAAPEIYIRNGAMVPIPEFFNTYWAHYAEMLYTCALLLAGQPLPGMLHLTAGILTALFTFLITRRIAGTKTGILAAVLFFSMPIISFESGSTYVDLFVALFVMAMVYAALCWWQTGRTGWLFWAGVMAGFGLGCKLSAAVFIASLGVLIGIGLAARHRKVSEVITGLLCFGGPLAALFLPWAVRDAVWTGNPFFPFFGSLFPNAVVKFGMNLGSPPGPNETWAGKLFSLPWNLVTDSRRFYHEAPGAVFGAIPLLALPWLYWKDLKKRVNRGALFALMFFGWGAVLIYFSISLNARYQIPGIPALAILAAMNFTAIRLPSTVKGQAWQKLFWGGAGLIALCVIFSGRLAEIMRIPEFPDRYPLALAAGRETSSAFLSRAVPVYDLFQTLNQQGGQPKVLSVGIEFRLYTTARIVGLLFAPDTRKILQDAPDETSLARVLEQQAFEYILLYPAEQRARPDSYQIQALTPGFLAHYTRLVAVKNNIRLYRFIPPGVERAEPIRNLLANPGFESGASAADLQGWKVVGNPIVVTTPGEAHTGTAALQIYGPGATAGYAYIYQDIAVKPGSDYTTAYWAAGDPAAALQLQVEWLDGQHQPLNTVYDWMGMGQNWQYADLILTAPPQAGFARIFASITGSAAARVDDLCFAEGDTCPYP